MAKQAQQVLLTSQNSQKQSDERIAEMQRREDARIKAAQAKRQQEMQRQKAIAASNQNSRANQQNNLILRALYEEEKAS